eukprot:snap_masked-scaffold1080_size63862-processed-gene-0.7 protein:Tk03557 transcript:snap_masked-scaffold1080_size63862-processed-gene-0.7-mRNA-1 annotation:"hypothetical protein D910_02457"
MRSSIWIVVVTTVLVVQLVNAQRHYERTLRERDHRYGASLRGSRASDLHRSNRDRGERESSRDFSRYSSNSGRAIDYRRRQKVTPNPSASALIPYQESHSSRNAPSSAEDQVPNFCWYRGHKYECGLSLSCVFGGNKALDLCNGGMIWSCCVPRSEVDSASSSGSSSHSSHYGSISNATFSDADPSVNEIHSFPTSHANSPPSSTSSSSSYYINSQHHPNVHSIHGPSSPAASSSHDYHFPTRPPRPPRASRPHFSRPPHPSSSTEFFSTASYEDEKADYEEHYDDHPQRPFAEVLPIGQGSVGSSPSSVSRASM